MILMQVFFCSCGTPLVGVGICCRSYGTPWVGISTFVMFMILVPQAKPSSDRVVTFFCTAMFSTDWQGIYIGHVCLVCCCNIKWNYCFTNGLDLVVLTPLPLAQSDWWSSFVSEFLVSVALLVLEIGGCRMRPWYTESFVVRNLSEQPMF